MHTQHTLISLTATFVPDYERLRPTTTFRTRSLLDIELLWKSLQAVVYQFKMKRASCQFLYAPVPIYVQIFIQGCPRCPAEIQRCFGGVRREGRA